MDEVLFLQDPKAPRSLAQISAHVFSLLHLTRTEERESSNSIDGHYFLGHASNIDVQVCHADEEVVPGYPFWIVLDEQVLRKQAAPAIDPAPESIAATLAAGGLNVFIPSEGWEMIGWIPSGKVFGA